MCYVLTCVCLLVPHHVPIPCTDSSTYLSSVQVLKGEGGSRVGISEKALFSFSRPLIAIEVVGCALCPKFTAENLTKTRLAFYKVP